MLHQFLQICHNFSNRIGKVIYNKTEILKHNFSMISIIFRINKTYPSKWKLMITSFITDILSLSKVHNADIFWINSSKLHCFFFLTKWRFIKTKRACIYHKYVNDFVFLNHFSFSQCLCPYAILSVTCSSFEVQRVQHPRLWPLNISPLLPPPRSRPVAAYALTDTQTNLCL